MPASRSGERLHTGGGESSTHAASSSRSKPASSRVPASRLDAKASSIAHRRALGDVSNFDKKQTSSNGHHFEDGKYKSSGVSTASSALRREVKNRGSASSVESASTQSSHQAVKRVRSSAMVGLRQPVSTAFARSASSGSVRVPSAAAASASIHLPHSQPITTAHMDLDAAAASISKSRSNGAIVDAARTTKRPASFDSAEDEKMSPDTSDNDDDEEEGDPTGDDDDFSSSEEDEAESDQHSGVVSQQARHRHQPHDVDIDDADSAESAEEDDSDAEAEAALLFNPDPDCLVSLPPAFQAEALHKVAVATSRYEQDVILPQMAKAAAERRAAVLAGEIPADIAAHDDELAEMGLDPEDVRDTSMVAEYSREIFAYMAKCEMETMANPNYMAFQNEIQWHMRATLVDWLLQVHMRYHMLPETLFIAINIIDRFLSVRVVSLAKLQLVGVIAMFIAAKYEEIVAPSVDEFVAMTEGGHSKDEIFKGERIILSTLDFKISSYCSPYSWVRKISKADDYDIQVRTLAKFLMEVTLLDHRFLRAKPSLIAAISMFLSKKMLGGAWDEGFIYYSNFCEEQLIPGANLLLEKLVDPAFEEQFVCRKYAARKFLKASAFARQWAATHTFGMGGAAHDQRGVSEEPVAAQSGPYPVAAAAA
ncbi:hypothetical protein BDZ90DRAFT_225336 [Jaminaea rosea]|uniref:Uncharacterized protein n=1 Tax=Jaminaea rosea TaxID=1569628 RepID=A0A316UZ15_9BASI|nr:hypothetical protein BDZ90DRAFT_225336 [Jaminaea rosea]PWN30557.1 hypothetical protein BDZ90DRAFT_225336 [Jaminaea rosea]